MAISEDGLLKKTEPKGNGVGIAPGIVAFLFIVALVLALAKPARSDALTVEGGVQSGHQHLDYHRNLADWPVIIGRIQYDHGATGLHGEMRGFGDFDDNSFDDSGSELDVLVGWKKSFGKYQLNLSASEWFMTDQDDFTTLTGSVNRSFTIFKNHTLIPELEVERQWVGDDTTFRSFAGLTHQFTIEHMTVTHGPRVNLIDEGREVLVYEANIQIPINDTVALVPYFATSNYIGSGDCITSHCKPPVCDENDGDSLFGLKLRITPKVS